MEKKNVFKENWLKTDKLCPTCSQIIEKQRGLTKQNVKRLFSFKLDANEIIFTALIILVIVLAYAYNHDTKQSREWINSMASGGIDSCKTNCNQHCELYAQIDRLQNGGGIINLTNITITNETFPR